MKTIFSISLIIIGILSQAQVNKADSLFSAGKYKEALAIYKVNNKAIESISLEMNRFGYCYHKTGDYKNALLCYNKAMELKPAAGLLPIVQSRMARAYAAQNKTEESLQWLNLAARNGYQALGELKNETDYNSIRRHPRFQQISDSIWNVQCPCINDPRKNEFDFWIGEWTVVTTQGRFAAGSSRIEKVSENCLVLENWTAGNGTSGKSMNYIDPATGKWEQTWCGSGGEVMKFINGVFDGKQMQFEFKKKIGDKEQVGRFHFYKVSDNEVRQMQESSSDLGATWTTDYDLTYIRNK
jgi:hypothetical protein